MRNIMAIFTLFGLLVTPYRAWSWQASSKVLPTLLVADVDLVELAPAEQRYDEATDAARTAMLSGRIRSAVTASGRYQVLNRSAEDRHPPFRYLACKACLGDWARTRGSAWVLVTWVQKESRLILSINMAVINVTHPDGEIAGGSVDLRGDTDATWLAGTNQLLERTLYVAPVP